MSIVARSSKGACVMTDIDLSEAWTLLDIAKAAELSMADECQVSTDAEIVPGVSAEWYLVQTFPGDDARALRWLARRHFGVFRPMQQRADRESGRVRQGYEPVFAGWLFVFCWMGADMVGRLLDVPGVRGLLCYPQTFRPVVIPEDFVQRLRGLSWVYDESAPQARTHAAVTAARHVKRVQSLRGRQRRELQRLKAEAKRRGTLDHNSWSAANRLEPGERIRLLKRALVGSAGVAPILSG